jgi:hypothetical protein
LLLPPLLPLQHVQLLLLHALAPLLRSPAGTLLAVLLLPVLLLLPKEQALAPQALLLLLLPLGITA